MATARTYPYNTSNSDTSFDSSRHACMSLSTTGASIIVCLRVSLGILTSIGCIGIDVFAGQNNVIRVGHIENQNGIDTIIVGVSSSHDKQCVIVDEHSRMS